MAKQRMIKTKFWDDNWVSNLDPVEKLMFIYLLTNQNTNCCGIYEIPKKKIAVDTGIEPSMVEKIIKRFEEDGKVYYFDGWIVITNFMKHQEYNPNMKKGAEEILNNIPAEIWLKIKETETLTKAFETLYKEFPIFKSKSKSKSKFKSKHLSADKPRRESDVQKIINWFFSLKGWDKIPLEEIKKRKIIYARFVKPARELLDLTENNVDLAKAKLTIIKNWAEAQEIDWGIETVFKKWFDLDALPQEKQKRPKIDGCPAYQKNGKWFIILPNCEHKEYVGELSKIVYE